MDKRTILLVKDNPDDELPAIRALEKSNIMNKIVDARDGAEAIKHLSLYWLVLNESPPRES